MAGMNHAEAVFRCTECDETYPVDPGDCGICGMSNFERVGDGARSDEPSPGDSAHTVVDAQPADRGTQQRRCGAPDCGQPALAGQIECDYCGAPLITGIEPAADVRAPDLVAADGTRIPLLQGAEVVLGRSPDESAWSRLMQGHPGVSRRHAAIVADNDVVRVRDLGSANGTWVNGIQIDGAATAPITDGITIGLGRRYLLTVRTTR